jgi:hypothetical protein
VLSSEYPRKLPLAKDAERMLDQWLKTEGEASSLQTLVGGNYGPQQRALPAQQPQQQQQQQQQPAEEPPRPRPAVQVRAA